MGKIAIIGSYALFQMGLAEKYNDLDLIGTYEDIVSLKLKPFYPLPSGNLFGKNQSGKIVEAKVAWEGSLEEEFLRRLEKDPQTISSGNYLLPSLNVLYMLKMTHRYLRNSPHFHKTMRDIKWFREMGCVIPSEWQDFYERLEKKTYDYPKPSLDQMKKDFFRKDSQELYGHNIDHDTIHLAVSVYDRPAYEFYKDDLAEVMCSKEKWDSCSDEIKLAGVYEESAVLALERVLISAWYNHHDISPEDAFKMALVKVCTSITSGWFREWAWENFDKVFDFANSRNYSFVQDYIEGISKGIVQERAY